MFNKYQLGVIISALEYLHLSMCGYKMEPCYHDDIIELARLNLQNQME